VARKSTRPQTIRGIISPSWTAPPPTPLPVRGIILITKGMLKSCGNEEQLAAVPGP